MVDVGHFSLVAACLLSIYGLIVGCFAARADNQKFIASTANSIYLCSFFSTVSLAALAVAFVNHDYRYVYVWQTSNNAMPTHYLVSAIWGGMDGSMLLWAVIMSLFSSLVLIRARDVQRDLLKWVMPVLCGATGFFLVVVTFLTNPFRLIPGSQIPADGNGLNPLLQNPSMMIHPPMLYIGFTGFVVPFAFCLAALISGKLSDNWIRATRRWTLVAWSFLTAGVILGGNWAYIELGWGGFWAWDPVENASFMPWLTGTAYLHSVMVQEQKGMLKIWNVVLAVLTYTLTVFGTFLTRSGVVQSVHAFAETDVGWVFLLYIGILIVLTLVLLWYRRVELRPERMLESYLSREAAFLFNNLILLGICFSTFWGVLFPLFSEAVSGEKSVVGPPFFNQVNVPLFIALMFLMGIGPLIAWRKSSLAALAKTFMTPLIAGSLLTLLFLYIDPSRVSAAVSFGVCLFVIITIESEFRRAARVRRQMTGEAYARSLKEVVRRRPRRYGGFLVHLGVAAMAVAITASMAYKIEKDITLLAGESVEVGRYKLTLEEIYQERASNFTAVVSKIKVSDKDSGEFLTFMKPERRAYTTNQEVTTEVALRVTPREDLYLAMAGLDIGAGASSHDLDLNKTPALFKVFVNPLQVWLWIGAGIVLFGSAILILHGLLQSQKSEQEIRAGVRAAA